MISFAVTAYEEHRRGGYAWVRECVAAASRHPLVSEVVVVDDGSSDPDGLRAALAGTPRLRLERLPVNRGVLAAKVESVAASREAWVMLADSDNVFGADYLDGLSALRLDVRTWYAASFGRPALDYRDMIGSWSLADVPRLALRPLFPCLANTGNQLVCRSSFVEMFDRYRRFRSDLVMPDWLGVGDRSDLRWRLVYDAADSFLLCSAWWRGGGRLEVVAGLEYVHGSLTNAHRVVCRSSWERAPAEKEKLQAVLWLDLLDAAEGLPLVDHVLTEQCGSRLRFAGSRGSVRRAAWVDCITLAVERVAP